MPFHHLSVGCSRRPTFGVFGSFVAVASVIGTAATLDYSLAIMLPKEREDAGQLFVLSCFVAICAALLTGVVFLLFPSWPLGLLQSQNGWLPAFLVLAVLAAGLNTSFQSWCVRVGAFKQTSASQVVRGAVAECVACDPRHCAGWCAWAHRQQRVSRLPGQPESVSGY